MEWCVASREKGRVENKKDRLNEWKKEREKGNFSNFANESLSESGEHKNTYA